MGQKGYIQVLGAAGTVTGSKYLVGVNGKKFLVDCGLFQGHRAESYLSVCHDASFAPIGAESDQKTRRRQRQR